MVARCGSDARGWHWLHAGKVLRETYQSQRVRRKSRFPSGDVLTVAVWIAIARLRRDRVVRARQVRRNAALPTAHAYGADVGCDMG